MGWWEHQQGVVLGDGPLDLTEDFLERVSREYQEEQGRKPTLEEILACLSLVLRNQGEALVADASGVVTEIVARTKKSPKRHQLRPGDVFSVPLGNGEHAFGRLTPQVSLIDFFEMKSSRPVRASRLKNVRVFRLPALVMVDPLKEGRWRIIDHLPYQDGEFQLQPFRIAGQIECGDKLVDGFIDPSSRLRPANSAELQAVPEHSLWNAELVEKELRERLAHVPETER